MSKEDPESLINGLLHGKDKVEALSWLKGSSKKSVRYLAEFPPSDSVKLIEQPYGCGAKEVWAVKFDGNPPYESINTLIVTLPGEKKKRLAVFDWSNQKIEEQGFDPENDSGQRHLCLWFD